MELTPGYVAAIVAITNILTGVMTAWLNGRFNSRKLEVDERKQRSDEDHQLFGRLSETVKLLGERVEQLSKETADQRDELHELRTENAVLKEGRDGDKARIQMLETLNRAQQRELEQMSKSTSAMMENFKREGCPAGPRCPMIGDAEG